MDEDSGQRGRSGEKRTSASLPSASSDPRDNYLKLRWGGNLKETRGPWKQADAAALIDHLGLNVHSWLGVSGRLYQGATTIGSLSPQMTITTTLRKSACLFSDPRVQVLLDLPGVSSSSLKTLGVCRELWCWSRLLRVPSTARSSQSTPKEINPEYSLEGLMLKLKLQYLGHLMLGKIEDKRRRGQQRTRWLDGITDWVDMSLSKLRETGMMVSFQGPFPCLAVRKIGFSLFDLQVSTDTLK